MDSQDSKPSKKLIPLSDACEFYVIDFEARKTGCGGQINITNRPPQFGVFFDGTGNNASNDYLDYYEKRPTNVFKLHELYPFNEKHFIGKTYIQGIGTQAGEKDSGIDMAIAYSFGDKVRQAVGEVQKFFRKDQFKNAPIGILDVFGFSRGAAAARHFVNEVHRLTLTDPKHFGGPQLHIRFLGLFDTVGSIGIPGDNSQQVKGESFVLDVNPNAVQHVFHLTARHEQREYFPLSSILTGPGQSPSADFEEIEIPGAHSDVGGGYGSKPDMVYYPEESFGWNMSAQRSQKLAELKAQYEKQYNEPGINIKLNDRDVDVNAGRITQVFPEWRRDVNPQLAHSALSKMFTKATEKGVPLEPLETLMKKSDFSNKKINDVYVLPSDLQDHLTRHEAYPDNTRIEDYLYLHYIHHSHQYRTKPQPWSWTSINSNKPKSHPAHAAPNGKREIFYNVIALGYSPADQWIRIPSSKFGNAHWLRKSAKSTN